MKTFATRLATLLAGSALAATPLAAKDADPAPQAVAAAAAAVGPTDADLMNGAATPCDILTYGMGPRAQRFSPLAQVNASHVARMVPAFSASLDGEKQRGQESQPIVYDGVIYVTGSYSRLFAFDSKTGEELWQCDARLPDGIMPCCDVVNRGAAIYGDKIIFGTLDAHMAALNRKTGKVIWNKTLAPYDAGYSFTGRRSAGRRSPRERSRVTSLWRAEHGGCTGLRSARSAATTSCSWRTIRRGSGISAISAGRGGRGSTSTFGVARGR